jgi:hypothetical protein
LPCFSTQLWTALRDKHFPPYTRNISLWISFALSPFPSTTKLWSSVVHSQARSPFWARKPASEHEHASLLPRLSWSWTVLLPSDTHRKPITSITTVLLPFLTNLQTLPRNWGRCYQDLSSLPPRTVRYKSVQCNYLVQVDWRSSWRLMFSGSKDVKLNKISKL